MAEDTHSTILIEDVLATLGAVHWRMVTGEVDDDLEPDLRESIDVLRRVVWGPDRRI